MAPVLDAKLRQALADRIRYYNELGIYDFYCREFAEAGEPLIARASLIADSSIQSEEREEMTTKARAAVPVVVEEEIFQSASTKPETGVADPVRALKLIRQDLGDCTRCRLHKQGRKQIVFGVGNPTADLMFIGEAPGADEDIQGEPFVGRAGQLLNNMIKAMGLEREQVYIANIIKCRPPGNRTPERDECETCSPFLMRQIEVI
jgi:DNA polymerase